MNRVSWGTVRRWMTAFALLLLPVGAMAQEGKAPMICPFCDLVGSDYSGKTLVGANLYHADLRGVSFRGAVLRGVNLSQADLADADFSGARLEAGPDGRPTDLAGANLTGADFTGASFADADMQFAEIGCASFRDADMTGLVAGPALSVDRGVCRPDFTGATLSCAMSIGGVSAPHCAGAGLSDVASAGWSCPGLDLSGLSRAVYVSTTGSDSGSCGADPSTACASVAKGVAQCSGAGCGVLIAAQQYSLSATLSLPAGTGLYGGCVAGGSADPSYTSSINGPADGTPVLHVSAATEVTLQSLRLYGKNAAGTTGAPAVAVLLTDGADVAFNKVQVFAGVGGAGRAGSDGSVVNCTRAAGGGAGPAMSAHVNYVWYSGEFQSCEPGGSNTANDGKSGASALSLLGGAGGKIGGAKCTTGCDGCTGAHGQNGAAGTHGACGAGGQPSGLTAGSFPSGQWTAAVGAGGTAGQSGSGGGGGSSGQGCARECELAQVGEDQDGGAGGSGGAGACGTNPGTGGQQGGASIGVQVVASSFSFEGLSITGAKGGNGGDGGHNAPAQVGAAGQSGHSGSSAVGGASVGGDGGTGGAGGWGGASGAGAGGNGGPSFGIAFVNAAEVANVATIAINEGASGEVGLPGDTQGNPSGSPCTADAAVKGHPGAVNKYQMFNE